jgi:outer membrane protein insertion porin family
VVSGSLTELAGRYSLDVRVTPSAVGSRSHSIVFTADGDEELVARLGELSEQVVAAASGGQPGRIVSLQVLGAADLEPLLRSQVASQPGTFYDGKTLQADRERLESHERVARVSVETERSPQGMTITFRVVRAEMIMGQGALGRAGETVVSVEIEGNRRIESDAIRSRLRTQAGERLSRAILARDVREVYSLGFFRAVDVLVDDQEDGVVVIFRVQENPVVRQISITGNDHIKAKKITEVLTLTTGSTLDYPLLHENESRIEQLYRAEGYYLAQVGFSIEETTEGAVSIDFQVEENKKLKLRRITFDGNEAFSDRHLLKGFSTKRWRFYSWATSWLDHTGTYSEPIFARDLREVEKKYTDAGYLQVEIGQPDVEPTEEGLFVTIKVKEGTQFHVGEIDVAGDETVDLEALRAKLKLARGDVFNRSFLTQDVESLERHYTDRGFYFASVQPGTRLSQETRTVDVQFSVQKGPLYFVRNVEIEGNTRTIDPVIRREVNVVEGQLYSARALQISDRRLRGLGFFEDVGFEPQPTDDPAQLDLKVNVVERPTGSFSFGAGYSSQDGLVFTASLAQANLFGRGYGVNLSVDVGGSTNRYFISLTDPYFLGSTYSFGGTLFVTDVSYNSFEQHQKGFDFLLGHALSEDNTSRGFLRYSYASREVRQDTGVNAAAPIFREILQGNESSSLIGLSYRRDTRDDRFAATTGTNVSGSLEYSGLGGFARYLRAEARMAWYMGAPGWLIDRSTFVISTRLGYALPFNQLSDWDLALANQTPCDDPTRCQNVGRLDAIDTDLRLPLTERYFLGGIGNFQLRGFRARTVGPRRAVLQRSGLAGTGDLFHPVGTTITYDSVNDRYVAVCQDSGFFTQGDGDSTCNQLNTKDIGDFADLDETDAIGGNSFISSSFEYRFPISKEVGLQGVFFVDGGNAFYEGQNLFDASQWRYGYGGGVLWFSPFGPLQLVLGFPIDPYSFEQSPVFEFSVGGFGL